MLNLSRTHEFLSQRLSELFKRFHLTPTQYNMLRILRGAGNEGITCSQACERMITPDPDMTRLLDRMENQGLLRRERGSHDRRVVISRITPRGLKLTNQIDEPLQELLRDLFRMLVNRQLQSLIKTLESLRNSPTHSTTSIGEK